MIGDIHGNLPALEAVLEDAKRRKAEAIWCLGDLVGYGPFPDEVVRVVRRRFLLTIRGNYDTKVLRVPSRDEDWFREKGNHKALAFSWAWENLSPESREHLEALPETLRLAVGRWKILLVHGSPESPREHLDPKTTEERLASLGEQCGADVVCCGHSHVPFSRRVGDRIFINPGSVGRSDDGDPRATYALVSFRRNEVAATFLRVPYDVESLAEAVLQKGLPEVFAQMFLQGVPLDQVRENGAGDGDSPVRRRILAAGTRYVEDSVQHHQLHVARLALLLFDRLQSLHGLDENERRLLEYAALLHDIGWVGGGTSHHKRSSRLVMEDLTLPLARRQRRMVAAVARYHRGGMPSGRHAVYRVLGDEDQRTVAALAALLRLADAMDASHRDLVEDLSCTVEPHEVVIWGTPKDFPETEDGEESVGSQEQAAVLKKRKLFRICFGREVALRWVPRS